ncbi:MAG: hypothetical protein GX335_07840 [Firmicutes bacterium]|nr:hypothetical protein [Bacillota bacterium]
MKGGKIIDRLEKIRQWLQINKDSSLEIKKEEDGHLDTAVLKLQAVNLVPYRDRDHYLPAQSLILKGRGTISTDFGPKPLPYPSYEIALTDTFSVQEEAGTLKICTERGRYTFKVQNRD